MSDGVDADTCAVVLTHRRPRLATALVRSLIDVERFDPRHVILVIDRDGGLDDPALEGRIRVIRLKENRGPAAGFAAGLEEAFTRRTTRFAYLCEDDVLLEGIHPPRVAALRGEVELFAATGRRAGAVVAYGRRFRPHHGGTTLPFVPDPLGDRLQPVDVAAWGATLVTREVWDAGVRPDSRLFFGYEDFDFFLQLGAAGFEVLVDRDSGAGEQASASSQPSQRPAFDDEPWRAFYVARNFFELARRHGDASWMAWHVLLSARRWQLARDRPTRDAILAGLNAGVRRQHGRDPRYVRDIGEWIPNTASNPLGLGSMPRLSGEGGRPASD